MRFIFTIAGTIDDETEAQAITDAVTTALEPFAEMDLETTSKVTTDIPTA